MADLELDLMVSKFITTDLVFYYTSETFVDDLEHLIGTYPPPAKIANSLVVLYFMGKCVILIK